MFQLNNKDIFYIKYWYQIMLVISILFLFILFYFIFGDASLSHEKQNTFVKKAIHIDT